MPIATESLLARRREPGEGQEVRLRRSAEAKCAPKNRSTARYLGGGRGRVFARADILILFIINKVNFYVTSLLLHRR